MLALLGATVTETKADAPGETASRSANRKVMSNDFSFQLSGCQRTGQSITCEFSVTNIASEDRGFVLYGRTSSNESSRLIDSSGNEFHISNFQLGTAMGYARRPLRLQMVPQVSTKASLTFSDPAVAKVTSIRLLRIAFRSEGKQRSMRGPSYIYTDFKNVPLQ